MPPRTHHHNKARLGAEMIHTSVLTAVFERIGIDATLNDPELAKQAVTCLIKPAIAAFFMEANDQDDELCAKEAKHLQKCARNALQEAMLATANGSGTKRKTPYPTEIEIQELYDIIMNSVHDVFAQLCSLQLVEAKEATEDEDGDEADEEDEEDKINKACLQKARGPLKLIAKAKEARRKAKETADQEAADQEAAAGKWLPPVDTFKCLPFFIDDFADAILT